MALWINFLFSSNSCNQQLHISGPCVSQTIFTFWFHPQSRKKKIHLISSQWIFCKYRIDILYMIFLQQKNKKENSPISYIINSRNFRRCKLCVIGPATWRVDPAASNPFLQNCIVNCKINNFINFSPLFFQHLIKLQIKIIT